MSGGWLSGLTTGASGVPGRQAAGFEPGGAPSGGTSGLSDFHQQGLAQAGAQTSPNGFENAIDGAIASYNSDTFQNVMTYGPMAGAAAYGAGTALAAGVTGTAVLGAAAAAAAPVVVAAVVGMVYFQAGFDVGEDLGHWAMNAMGYDRIAGDGEMPATVGHPIAHVSGWSLGAMVLGAVAAVAVGALIVVTAGAALGPIMLAATVAAASGATAGIGFGFASAAGQYGTNKGTIKTGSPNVRFRNKPVARVTDIVDCSDHAVSKVAEGAETVFANNWPIARIGHRTTCDAKINDGVPDIAIDIDTSAIALPIDVGWQSRAANLLVIATDILPLGGRRPRPGTPSHGQGGNAPLSNRCGFGCPVDVATGEYLDARTDISIPGTIPLRLDRVHAVEAFGVQGKSWAGTWAQHLRIDGEAVTFQNTEGTLIAFHAPDDEVLSYNMRFPHLELLGRRGADLFIHDRRARLIYVFADEGGDIRRLARIEDRNGNKITFRYGMDGLRRVDHSDGFSLQIHSEGGLIRHAVLDAADGEDCVFAWGYNRAGQLTEVRSSQTGFMAYTYDPQGRIIGWRDAKSTRVHYEYGPQNRIGRIWSDSGHAGGTLDYDLKRKRTVTRTDEGAVTVWDWTDDGTIWRVTDPMGQIWLTEWDDAFHAIAQVDPLGHRSTFDHDALGNLVRHTNADGHVSEWEYDREGLMTAAIDPEGNRLEFRHDDKGNMVGTTDALGRIATMGLGAKGEVVRIDLPGDVQHRIFYDPLLRPSRRRNPDGHDTRMGYDTEGRLRWFTDEIGATTRYDRTRGPDNPRGALRQLETEEMAVSTLTWDVEGQLSSITDPSGSTRHFRFGAFDLPVETVDAQGHRLRLEHDREMRLTALINELGQRYEYRYDAASRVIAERDYSGQVTRYVRDDAGRVTQTIAPDGTRTKSEYSPAGLLLRQWIDGAGDSGETRFEYDARGLMIRAVNGVATVEYDYDAIGRVVAERLNGREITSEYSLAGQRIARAGDVLHLTAGWSRAGLPVDLRIGEHAPLKFGHDPRGLERLRQSQAGFVLSQSHTVLGNLAEQIAGPMMHMPDEMASGAFGDHYPREFAMKGGAHRHYEWDRVGRAISITDQVRGQVRFDYDRRGQVTTTRRDTMDGGSVLSHFEYDPARNLAAVVEAGREQPVRTVAGRINRRGNVTYRHDECGRVIEKRVEENGFRPRIWRMAWDGLGQLAAVETPEGEVWHYAYDPLGRRVARLADGKGGVAYQWEGDRLIAEAPMTASGEVAWGEARHWVYDDADFRPIAQIQQGRLHHIVTDHLGTPREMFSEDGEQVTWRAELSLWGEMIDARHVKIAANDDAPPTDCPIRFQGQWHDPESGLHYNRFRYYDPEATQYLSPDPIGLMGGVRPQAYVEDPNDLVDPYGLQPCSANGTAPGNVRFQRWRRGDAIDKPMPDGSPPTWNTVRGRYWRNRADQAAPGEFSRRDLNRMRRGSAPLDYNPRTGKWEPRELHHVWPQQYGGGHTPLNLRELTPDWHGEVDPFRHTRPTIRGIR